jgi:hypothetical protein
MTSSIISLPTLDNSAASSFNLCARLFDLENRKKLLVARQNLETGELEPARSQASAFGDLLHEGMRVWYRTYDPMIAMQAIIDRPYTDSEDDYRTKEKAIDLFGKYLAHYGKDPHWQVLFTETAFEIIQPEIDFKWGGKIDLVVRWNDKLWIVDHKTTSAFDKNWWLQFFPDMQTAGYAWAASLLHGEPIFGAIINMLQVNNNKKEKSPEELFQRKWFIYEPHHIEEWQQQARRVYQRIAVCEAEGEFPPNWHACTVKKYGPCSWNDYCRQVRPENRARFLANETVPNTWDFRDT